MTTVTEIFSINFDSASVGIGFTTVPVRRTSSFTSSPTMGGIVTNTSTTLQAGTSATSTSSPSSLVSASTSTTSAAASPMSTASIHHSGPSTGQTIGIIVGVVAAATLLICLIFYVCWKQKRRSARQDSYSQKYLAQKRTSLLGRSRPSFHIQAHRPLYNPARANQQNRWPGSVGSAGAAGTVVQTDRCRSQYAGRNSQTRPRTLRPISEPIPEERPEVLPSFEDRFFATPSPAAPLDPNNPKHASDATTIRTSGNPPTPNRPAISLLRLQSTRTSKGTMFEEDGDPRQDQVPPLPTFTAVQVPLQSIATTSDQDKPTRLTLEAGIKRSISKAISHMPTAHAHTHEDSTIGHSTRPKITRSKDTLQPQHSIPTSPGFSQPGPSWRSRAPSTQPSPQSPYPMIPERSSSRQGSRHHSDEELLLGESDTTTPRPEQGETLQPPPLAIRKNESSIKDLAYPRIPVSASERYHSNVSSSLQAPFDPWSRPQPGPAEHVEKYSKRPLPPVVGMEDPFVESTPPSHIVRQFKLPSRLYIPPAGQSAVQGYRRDDLVSPEATLTPNRTNTGDLVLTVDM